MYTWVKPNVWWITFREISYIYIIVCFEVRYQDFLNEYASRNLHYKNQINRVCKSGISIIEYITQCNLECNTLENYIDGHMRTHLHWFVKTQFFTSKTNMFKTELPIQESFWFFTEYLILFAAICNTFPLN